ncbi:F-box protein-like [Forsythia ovata]|uniref:F-box protein-like n=1 Tax=Forsythia ovata TaxID=205694 RepID=A0ABD1X490_9LAMI
MDLGHNGGIEGLVHLHRRPIICILQPPQIGQSSSRSRSRSAKPVVISPWTSDSNEPDDIISDTDDTINGNYYMLNLPDECLACIFQSLAFDDPKQSALVCCQWLRIEA